MNVSLLSYFRDSLDYLQRYFAQTGALAQALSENGHSLRLILVEGDSSDATWEALQAMAPAGSDLSQCHHGGPNHGSVVDLQRFRQLAQIGNHALARIPADADAVIIVESDLLWSAESLMQLLYRLDIVRCVAPMVLLSRPGWPERTFYDTWAFRIGGQRFGHYAPYFNGWPVQGLTELDSAGSCLVMWGELARMVRYTPEEVIVGLCKDIYEQGSKVWLDPTVAVYHE